MSTKIWKDGIRQTNQGKKQRYICRECGYRFTETEPNSLSDSNKKTSKNRMPLNTPFKYLSNCQICVSKTKAAKNLVKVEPQQETAKREGTNIDTDTKGKLFEFSWWMKKQGYAEETNKTYIGCLKMLLKKGANLYDPESIKDSLTRQNWSPNRKLIAINSYTLYLKMNKATWEKPRCKVSRKIPFIPTEKELNTLIDKSGKKTSTFLLLLKETAMRCGEAKRILWTDLDSERRIIILNEPEKGSKPRAWKISIQLVAMLNRLPKKSKKIFGDGPVDTMKNSFFRTRKRLATILNEPRLQRISFHTFRHWKATTLYHQTKDIYYVKEFLGHKSIKNTEIYITIERTLFDSTNDEFNVKITKDPEEIKELLETGFDYICQKDELIFLRKRK